MYDTNPPTLPDGTKSIYSRMPIKMVRALEYLVAILAIGASGSILLLFFWVVTLNDSTNKIIQTQKESKRHIEENQAIIMSNQQQDLAHQKVIIEYLEKLSKDKEE